jgi:hypothetical protein
MKTQPYLKGKCMKTRMSLVSNSSSSSFIVAAQDKEYAENQGLVLVPVRIIKNCFAQLKQLDLEFMTSECYYLKNIEDISDDSFISKPYDRDDAYRQGINYPVFAGDL